MGQQMRGGSVCHFGLLENSAAQQRRQWGAFATGVAIHGLAVGSVVLLGILLPSKIEDFGPRPPLYIDLVTRPKPRAEHVPVPPKSVWKMEVPKLPTPRVETPLAPPLQPVPILVELPKVSVQAPPEIQPSFPSAPVAPQSRPASPPPRTGVFAGRSEVATLKLPARAVQTGGFGSPNGFPGDAQGESLGNVVRFGSFNLPSGEGYGNGTGGTHGARGTVASAGFTSGVAVASGVGSGQGGAGGAVVRPSGFDAKPSAPKPAARRLAPEKPWLVPVEILSKPTPVYTDAARKVGREGEVVLSVVFEASGKLDVVRVIQGLGYGLDEAACRAAEAIRFKPAQRDGKPVDFPATLRVLFQLAGSTDAPREQT